MPKLLVESCEVFGSSDRVLRNGSFRTSCGSPCVAVGRLQVMPLSLHSIMCTLFAAGLRQRGRIFVKSSHQHFGCHELGEFHADGRRYFADRGPMRKDYSDPGFQRKGYVSPSWFANTQNSKRTKRNYKGPDPDFVSGSWETDSYQRQKERRNLDIARREFEGKNDLTTEVSPRTRAAYSDYPYTGSSLDEISKSRRDTGPSEESRNTSAVERFKSRGGGRGGSTRMRRGLVGEKGHAGNETGNSDDSLKTNLQLKKQQMGAIPRLSDTRKNRQT